MNYVYPAVFYEEEGRQFLRHFICLLKYPRTKGSRQ